MKVVPVEHNIDVSWTGDLPVRYLDRPAPKVEAKRIAGIERPAFERHELPKERVSCRVWKKAKGPPGVGWVSNASVTGMWIETDTPLPMRTQVQVELVVPGGYSTTIPGRVIRANEKGMAIHLTTDDSSWQFRSSFLELARRSDSHPPSVIVRRGDVEEEDTTDVRDEGDFRVLGAKWHEVLGDLHDDAIHQEFIQECLRRQRLEFGLERYRELKGGPDDAIASKYLAQIGVILGFMGFKKKAEEDKEKRTRAAKIALACLSVFGALLLARQLFMTKVGLANPPPSSSETTLVAPRVDPPPPVAPVKRPREWTVSNKRNGANKSERLAPDTTSH